jgi:hypothetical protein
MSTESDDRNESGNEKQQPRGRSAGEDLIDGLGLMLRAARKAVDSVDTRHIEQLGRRATERLAVGEWEEVAERGGRKVLSVLGRLAHEVDERLASAVQPRASRPDATSSTSSASPATENSTPGGSSTSTSSNAGNAGTPDGAEPKPRARVGDE